MQIPVFFQKIIVLIILTISATCYCELPEPTPEKMPVYRGFNLTDKFYKGSNAGPFQESDFQMICELGFNFVRLPMDYRLWIKDGDWQQFDLEQMAEIDKAIEYGQKYNIHVCMNFHRAPGYTVASPPEKTDLWTDPETQRICAMHWGFFARRYKDIPNKYLSFNLLNEPHGVDKDNFVKVITMLVEAIRNEDPNRLIISDGLSWGMEPCRELDSLNIVQATRGYQPMNITHYKAEWVNVPATRPATWPQPLALSGYLYGPDHKELQSPVQIIVNTEKPCILGLKIGTVSRLSNLQAAIDGKIIWQQKFTPGPGEGPWEKAVLSKQWNIYQNIYNRYYTIDLPSGNYTVEITNTEGDWLTISEIQTTNTSGNCQYLETSPQWGQKNFPLRCNPDINPAFSSYRSRNAQWLYDNYLTQWVDLKNSNHGVIVGEWGSYKNTPHAVTLAWMEDCLKNYQKAGIGWALWNFRGSFGILDSNREDVEYESFQGYKLDRKMLELLQKY